MIKLNKQEQKICTYMAKSRYEEARSKGVKDARIDNSGEFLDLNGFGAEMAFCKLFNLYPDFSISARSGTADALTRKGNWVDVKATKYRNGHLLATKMKKDKENTGDIYALMVGEMPEYRFAGWVYKEELLLDEHLRDLGMGEGYAMSQDQLKIRKDI